MQLPQVCMRQQQLQGVMWQVLTHELSSLPRSLQAESAQRVLPVQATSLQGVNYWSCVINILQTAAMQTGFIAMLQAMLSYSAQISM